MGIEEFQWRPADEIPAAGRIDRIDARLRTGNGDRAGGDARARRFEARRDERVVQFAQVGEARREAHHVNRVGSFAVETDDIFDLQMQKTRDGFEINAVFAPVSHRDL